MAVTLTGTGGLFKRLGRLAGGLADVLSIQGGPATSAVGSGASMATRGTNIEADAAESPAVSPEIDGHWSAITAWRSAQSVLATSFSTLAQNVIVRQVHLDANLPSQDLETALRELIRQMEASGDDLNASSVSAGSQTNGAPAPTGNAKVVVSVKNARGYTVQTPFAETLRFTVTGDSQTGDTARNETVTVRGGAAVSDVFDYRWPAGSGANVTVNIVDAQSDNSRNNMLYNGDFETFTTSNYPDNWVISTGAAGSTVLSSTDAYTGSKSLKLTGDGSTLITVYQPFDTAATTGAGTGGTPAELEPLTQYAVGFWMKRDAALSAGVLRVALVDGSNTVINDDAGNANSFTVDLTGGSVTTSYAFFSGTFCTPRALPSTGVRLQFRTTTAHDNGDSILIDDVGFTEVEQLYAGGPSVAVFAGSTKVVAGDYWTVAVSVTHGLMALWLERMLGLRALGLQFPSDAGGTETIADSLVA